MVREAEGTGAIGLLRRSVMTARAAGILALVDLVEPTRKTIHPLAERLANTVVGSTWKETAAPETALSLGVAMDRGEPHELTETFAFEGVFDVTRLGWTRLAA